MTTFYYVAKCLKICLAFGFMRMSNKIGFVIKIYKIGEETFNSK